MTIPEDYKPAPPNYVVGFDEGPGQPTTTFTIIPPVRITFPASHKPEPRWRESFKCVAGLLILVGGILWWSSVVYALVSAVLGGSK